MAKLANGGPKEHIKQNMLKILGATKHNKMSVYLDPINGNYLKRNIS